jgi:splicing factor 4
VTERRKMDKKYDELQYETYRNTPSLLQDGPLEPKIFGSTQESKAKTVTIIRNDDSESTNSDTETWKEAKERNLKSLKRKAIHSRSRKQQDLSTTDSSDDDNHHDDNARLYDRKFKMSSATSSSSSGNSKKSGEPDQTLQVPDQTAAQLDKSSESSARPPKRKKSRWGEAPEVPPSPVPASTAAPSTAKPMLTTITRSDPALLQYARQNFGTTNLSEEDWKKAEEHFKINLLFQDMQRKRQELDHMAKNGKFKFEYDSDEDVNGGTWEHKLRSQEMEATLKWAEALNQQCEGRHHIGDFLPPEELKKFMEKYQSQQNGTQPDVSDYKEFKLKEDNLGYQMLQKLGWKGEGNSLGASGSGITEPINK